MLHDFRQVDVFGDGPFSGNPVAVVAGAQDLSDAQMRAISRWTNLSECTFLLPPGLPGADYRVRIFALETELPFAGHPTLGTARAWLEAGGIPQRTGVVVQECAAGLVEVRIEPEKLAFHAPPVIRSGPLTDQDRRAVVAALGLKEQTVLDAAWVDNGPGWAAVLVDSAETVFQAVPDPVALGPGQRQALGVVGLYPQGAEVALEVRGFFPNGVGGLVEDPVTGSLNASVAQWLIGSGRLSAPYVAAQGAALGRRGRISISAHYPDGDPEAPTAADSVWVGGRAEVRVQGTLRS